MLPRLGSSKLVSRWILATLVVSIVAVMDHGWLLGWLALEPALVWRGQIWRLVTWALLEPSAISLIVTCVALYRFGGDLAQRWGDRRLQRYALEVIGGAAVVTVVLALIVAPVRDTVQVGGWAVNDAIVIAWARQFPDRVLLFFGVLPLSGRRLIALTIATTCLVAYLSGPLSRLPELLVCAAAYYYPRERLARS